MEQFQLKLDCWLHWQICEKKKRKKWTIHKNLFYYYLFFWIFVFSFDFRLLNQNNLTGTIPTQIGLMTSLQQLWEEKKKRPLLKKFFFYSFILYLFLVIFFKTIWMEQFQLKLDWWLHWRICEKNCYFFNSPYLFV